MKRFSKNRNILLEVANKFGNANKKSNFILISTIVISITALFVMMSLILGRVKVEGIKTIWENGSAATVILDKASESQYRDLLNLSYVSEIGIINEFGYWYKDFKRICSCSVVTEEDFQKILMPAYENIKGNYPQKADDIMLPMRVLERLGIEEPEIGMDIPADIVQSDWMTSGTEDIHLSFRLSGYYTDYVSDLDELPTVYFSESFMKKQGISRFPAKIYIKSDQMWFSRNQIEKQLYKDANIGIEQNFRVINEGMSLTLQKITGGVFVAIAGTVLILLSMVLFIYNIFMSSLDSYKKQFGLLKVVGATSKQIQRIFLLQSVKIIIAGSILGGILGSVLVKYTVPGLIEKMYLAGLGRTECSGFYSFKMLILSVCLAELGVLVAFWHCIHLIVNQSPIECLQSKGRSICLNKRIQSKRGSSILLIAWRNFIGNRKKVSLTTVFLFLGIEVSLLSTVITNGLDQTNKIRTNPDFEIGVTKDIVANYIYRNNGNTTDTLVGHELLPKEFMNYIMEAIKIEPENFKECIGSYGVFNYNDSKALDPRRYSYQSGTDIITELTLQVVPDEWIEKLKQYINKKELNIDIDTFKNKNGFLLLHSNELSPQQKVEAENVNGKNLSGVLFQDGGKAIELTCCGYLDFTSTGFPALQMPWGGKNLNYIIISSKTMISLDIQPVTYQISFDVPNESESRIKSIIQNILAEANQMSEDGNIYYLTANSDIFAKEQSYIFATRIVMGAFCGIILLFAIFSYCNMIITDMIERRMEFAVMQSIGMTKKQLLNMLLGEGCFFSIGILVLLGSIGNIIIIIVGKWMEKQVDYFKFQFPYQTFLILSVLLILITIIIPITIYYGIGKESVVERLKNTELHG